MCWLQRQVSSHMQIDVFSAYANMCVHIVYLYVKCVCMYLLLYIMSLDVLGNTAVLLGAQN